MSWRANLSLFVACFLYVTVGGLVFFVLEYTTYTPLDITTTTLYTDFLASHRNVTASELASLVQGVLSLADQGGVLGNATTRHNGWTYDNAVYFAVTVVSTVGYGHVTPKTQGGKVFCIFYAVVGIPLFAAFLASIGPALRSPLVRLHRARPWYPSNPHRDKALKSAVLLSAGTVIMLCVPAVVFSYLEDWDYLSAVYYSTITLLTIGFGDLVAGIGGTGGPLYKLLMSVWLVAGLAFLALLVTDVSSLYASSGGGDGGDCSSSSRDRVDGGEPAGSWKEDVVSARCGGDQQLQASFPPPQGLSRGAGDGRPQRSRQGVGGWEGESPALQRRLSCV